MGRLYILVTMVYRSVSQRITKERSRNRQRKSLAEDLVDKWLFKAGYRSLKALMSERLLIDTALWVALLLVAATSSILSEDNGRLHDVSHDNGYISAL
jgi:hypothetical protein